MVLLKMKSGLFFAILCVSCATVLSEGDNEIKRGLYPYMGFLYYTDETVLDSSGSRFFRAAVLIRPEWLLSSTIEMSVGFPRKTLLARMGAIAIDANITLNEDENEQEREIIQIARPNVDDPGSWWSTDISLLKTLLPFSVTIAVAPVVINPKHDYSDKSCIILVYTTHHQNSTEERTLTQLSVDMLPSTVESCGSQFSKTTMACATTENENTNKAIANPEFCLGNSGGPLVCENEVMGLQTYIDNNCKPPHLYQLLYSWESFIKCGVGEKCNQDYICNICTATNKDDSSSSDVPPARRIMSTVDPPPTATNMPSNTSDTPITIVQTKDDDKAAKDDKSDEFIVIDTKDIDNKVIKIEIEDKAKKDMDDKTEENDEMHNDNIDNKTMLTNETSLSEVNMTKSKDVINKNENDVGASAPQTTTDKSSMKTAINASVEQDNIDGRIEKNATIVSGRKTDEIDSVEDQNDIKQNAETNSPSSGPEEIANMTNLQKNATTETVSQAHINETTTKILIDSNVHESHTNATAHQNANDSILAEAQQNDTLVSVQNKSRTQQNDTDADTNKSQKTGNIQGDSNKNTTRSSHVYIKSWTSPGVNRNVTEDAKQPAIKLTDGSPTANPRSRATTLPSSIMYHSCVMLMVTKYLFL